MPPKKDDSERLLKHDDISTSLIVDPLMGFKRLKLSGLELPPFQPQDEDAIKKILESVKSTKDAVAQLLNCDYKKIRFPSSSTGRRLRMEGRRRRAVMRKKTMRNGRRRKEMMRIWWSRMGQMAMRMQQDWMSQ